MQLISLTLSGYRRFVLGVFETFTLTPSTIEQVILGSNGSGKSSLLSEVYNIVPHGDSFADNGWKEYIFQHNNKLYKATSTFKAKNKAGHHSFAVSDDGEVFIELNESGLQSDQHMLVKEHVGLDQALIDLMVGSSRLSTMDPPARRSWMMRICGTDFDYISKLHQILKKRHSDYRGTVNILSENLGEALKDISTIVDDVKSQAEELEDLQVLSNNISQKLEEMGSVPMSASDLRRNLAQLIAGIEEDSDRISQLFKGRKERFRYLSNEMAKVLKEDSVQQSSQLTGRIRALQDRLRDIETAIDAIGRENLKAPSNVTQRLEELTNEINGFGNVFGRLTLSLEEVIERIASADTALMRVQNIVGDMPMIDDMATLKQQARDASERQKLLTAELNELTTVIQKLAVRIEHYEHADKVDCPECSHRFVPGMSKDLAENFYAKIKKSRLRENEILTELGNINQTLETWESVVGVARQYRSIAEQHANIDDFWKVVDDQRMLFKAPLAIVSGLNDFITQHRRQRRYLELCTERDKLLNLKASMEGNSGHLLEQADKVEAELFQLRGEHHSTTLLNSLLEEDLNRYQACEQRTEQFNFKLDKYIQTVQLLYKATDVEHLVELRKKVNLRMGTLHALQVKHKNLTQRIETLNEQIVTAKGKYEEYKLLDKATSSTEGVGADIIRGFMAHFLEHMNRHLSKVWSYDLSISETPDKGQAFNCQFPLHVAGSDKPVADFKQGSTGQVSMIDFAFKLVVFKLLGFKDMPLLADEFGKDFDDEHRERLVSYIRDMIEEKQYSQLFMISHYSSVYSAFDLAEFIVLDARNITKPAVYNTGVTFR